jgi:hypothetical protein
VTSEDALQHQAGDLRLERLALAGQVLDQVGRPPDRRDGAANVAARADRDGQAVPRAGVVDRPEQAPAERVQAAQREQDLDEAAVRRQPLDLGHGRLYALGRDRDRATQPRVAVQPLGAQPVVEAAGQRSSQVLGVQRLDRGQRAHDRQRRARSRVGLARSAARELVARLQAADPALVHRVAPVGLETVTQRRNGGRRHREVAVDHGRW